MKQTGTVGDKGQVTIPIRLRRRLGLSPGTALRFDEREGALVAVRVDAHDPIGALVGLGKRASTAVLLGEMRGPAWDPDLDGQE